MTVALAKERVQEDKRRQGDPQEPVVLSNFRNDHETYDEGERFDIWHLRNAAVACGKPVKDDDGGDEADLGE